MTATAPDLPATAAPRPTDRHWRSLVEASGGCAKPVRLHGSTQIRDRHGTVLLEHGGDAYAPCGNRRASVCLSCSDRYAGDAFHLLRAGLAGDDTKQVPATVAQHPRAFLTLTAPSFGPVHTRTVTHRGHVRPCRCRRRHNVDDPAIGTALNLESYDYVGAVLWQAHATALWNRFTTALVRALAAQLGVAGRRFREYGRLSYAKVAEYQRRGLVHFHAAVRLDGPDGPADPCPAGLDDTALHAAIRHAATAAALTVDRPDGTPLLVEWGDQLDLRPITSTAAEQIENPTDGEITDTALAGYIAKYATKTTGAVTGPDRPIRDGAHIAHLDVTEHHRWMIETCWRLGGLPQYRHLGLRRWAHMLGFRGHFLTKSRRYSLTFTDLRRRRRTWRLMEDLGQLDPPTTDPDTVVVINDWRMLGIGHRNNAECDLAAAVAERRHQPTIRGRTQ